MRPVRVIVAGEPVRPVRDVLERAGLRVVAEAESEEKALVLAAERDASAIVHVGMPNVHCSSSVPTVVVGDEADVAAAAALGAFGAVPVGANEAHLAAVIELAVARCADVGAAIAEAESLRDQLEARKVIERAKGILMVRLGLSEHEAYRRLQKASQDENRRMRDIAESVISTEKIMVAGADDREQGRSAG